MFLYIFLVAIDSVEVGHDLMTQQMGSLVPPFPFPPPQQAPPPFEFSPPGLIDDSLQKYYG